MLRRVFRDEGRKHLLVYLTAIGLGAITSAMGAASAWILEPIFKGLIEIDMPHIMKLAAAVLGIYICRGLADYAQTTLMARVGNRVIANIQKRLFDHIIKQNMSFFSDRHSAQLIALNTMVSNSTNMAAGLIVGSITNVMAVISFLGVMIYRDSLLAGAALIGMPLAVLGIRYLAGRMNNVVKRQYVSSGLITSVIQEAAQGIRVVKSFGMEDRMRERMAQAVAVAERMGNRISELGNRSGPIMETLGGVAIGLVIVYGGWRISSGALTLPALTSFLTAFFMVYAPAKALAKVNVQLASALIGIRMYYEVMDLPADELNSDESKSPLAVKGGRIEFEDVHFGYKPDEPVLRGLNLVAEAGQTTALVGQSGGGKSTILNLILRFYDPQTGRLAVDGQNVADVSIASLRRAMAYVGQDVFLFAGTIGENIASGRPEASQDEIEAAARAAHAHDFISSFPDGYNSAVGERGTQLSGGQRARIAIARAILRDAPVILLDEATAALDSESEQAVQTALDKLCAGRTVIVIAHRLQTIQNADRICVVEGGRIVEQGSHEELLAYNGRYAFLHSVQFREEQERRAG